MPAPPSYAIFKQQPGRPEIVTFGDSWTNVLTEQLDMLNVKRVFVVVSKSLAESSSIVDEIKNLPALVQSKLAGVKIGVRPHGYSLGSYLMKVIWKTSSR
jgi:hypothetical protein